MQFRTIRSLLVAGLVACLFAGCYPFGAGSVEVRTLWGYAIGTSYTVRVVATERQAKKLDTEIRSALNRINDSMSTYLPRSELSRFNDAPVGEWVRLSDDFYHVLAMAMDVAETSNGAFDPTIGPLVDLWGFGPIPRTDSKPSDEEIEAARRQVGYQGIELDSTEQRARKLEPRALDLSGIAKGHATDVVADLIEAAGIESYLVEIGGELRINGKKPDGTGWRIAIETPDSRQGFYRILELSSGAMATSGDYRNYYEEAGVRYSHTINPATGLPIDNNLASVTVLTQSSAMADAYATVFMVLGVEQSLVLADRLEMSLFVIERTEDGFKASQSRRFIQLFGASAQL
ncbi:MAG: FAD:protein FMN transferase [Saccharospirillum sp.]|nr:FAD:protein FMN transferase [Saccharospirillum sp.]